MLAIGDKVPDVTVKLIAEEGARNIGMAEYLAGRKVLVFAVIGAYTSNCSDSHVPGYIVREEEIKAKGVDTIACLSTSDFHVMDAWSKELGTAGKIDMLADGNSEFTRAVGMEVDLSAVSLGLRTNRYAMVVDDGVVTHLEVEKDPGFAELSAAEHMLSIL